MTIARTILPIVSRTIGDLSSTYDSYDSAVIAFDKIQVGFSFFYRDNWQELSKKITSHKMTHKKRLRKVPKSVGSV